MGGYKQETGAGLLKKIVCKDGIDRSPYTLAQEIYSDLIARVLCTDEDRGPFEQALESIVGEEIDQEATEALAKFRGYFIRHIVKRLPDLDLT